MSEENQNTVGSLEKRNISVETVIHENVLTSPQAKSIRFHLSKPKGYSLEEVDNFIRNIVQPSIDWYIQSLYERDKTVHLLGDELDKAETDIINLRSQIQFLEYNSKIEEGISRNSDDKEVADLMSRLTELQAQLDERPAAVNDTAKDEYIAQIVNQYNALLAQYTELAAKQTEPLADEELSEKYNNLLQKYTELETINVQLNDALQNPASNPEQEAYIADITDKYNELSRRYETDVAALTEQVNNAPASDATDVADITAKYDELLAENKAKEGTISHLQAELAQSQEFAKSLDAHITVLEDQIKSSPQATPAAPQVNKEFPHLPPGIREDDLV